MKKPIVNSLEPSQQQLNSLLEHYQAGRYVDAGKLSVSITEEFPKHPFAWKVLGAVLKQMGKLSESLVASQKSVQLNPQDAEVHNNLGVLLKEQERLDEAEASYRQAIALKPDYAEAHYNLGNILNKLGRLEDAEVSYRKAITLKPDHAEVHYNLGVILQKLERLDLETNLRKGIKLKPDQAKAQSNLGNIIQQQSRLEEAEASFRQVIALKPDYAEAHNNLGIILKELGKLKEAEASLRQAIALKPDFAEAYCNLGVLLRKFGRLKEAEAKYRKAIILKPNFIEAMENLSLLLRQSELLKILEKKKSNDKIKKNSVKKGYTKSFDNDSRLSPNPFISYRKVEPELLASLYKINSTKLDHMKTKDARYGNGSTNEDWQLFKNDIPILKMVEKDLTNIISQVVKSDIFILDTFFNILRAGSGSTPHQHLDDFDTANNLIKKKYAFAYYLTEGDKNSSEPGVFKLYDPDKEILPSEGTMIIFPAGQKHSAVYDGKTDRVMIGVNFYSLL